MFADGKDNNKSMCIRRKIAHIKLPVSGAHEAQREPKMISLPSRIATTGRMHHDRAI